MSPPENERPSTPPDPMTGAEILWQCLEREGVDRVFGYPGGAILPAYDAMTRYPSIRHVLARHEQGATHMADGWARASGRPGVVIATSGPGATNLVTGLGTAMMDSSPIVCITGQVPTTAMGSDAFQETDTVGITESVTKHNYLVTHVDDLAFVLHEAFAVARDGRPGPVLVDLPKDVQLQSTRSHLPTGPIRLPGPTRRPIRSAEGWSGAGAGPVGLGQNEHGQNEHGQNEHGQNEHGHSQYSHIAQCPLEPGRVATALELIARAERPVVLAGHGVLLSGASAELRELAERTDTPVALTLLGKGAFPEDHPLCLGMMGMHGTAAANHAIQRADLLLAFGMRFDDRVTGNLETYARESRKIHIDIDPAEIGKRVPVDVGLAGDLRAVLGRLLPSIEPRRHDDWRAEIECWREDERRRDVLGRAPRGDSLLAAEVIDALWRHTGGDGINVTDVGQHQMWEAQYFPHSRPGTLYTSGGMGTMGFALPAAIGIKMARPDEEVWAIVGDGGFQMTMAELATAVQEGVEINIAVINNGYLGMVRQWQEFFYDQRYHATPILSPDFCRVADAFGIPSVRVARRDQLAGAIASARERRAGAGAGAASRGGPMLLEFVVEQHDAVFPMVPAGADLHGMIRRPHAAGVGAGPEREGTTHARS